MRVKPVDPNAIIRDPRTKRSLPAAGGVVPDSIFWTRRLLAGEVVRIDVHDVVAAQPLGNEPVAPLTTRARR